MVHTLNGIVNKHVVLCWGTQETLLKSSAGNLAELGHLWWSAWGWACSTACRLEVDKIIRKASGLTMSILLSGKCELPWILYNHHWLLFHGSPMMQQHLSMGPDSSHKICVLCNVSGCQNVGSKGWAREKCLQCLCTMLVICTRMNWVMKSQQANTDSTVLSIIPRH